MPTHYNEGMSIIINFYIIALGINFTSIHNIMSCIIRVQGIRQNCFAKIVSKNDLQLHCAFHK